jgi:GAF domain-containing protein
MRAEPAPPRRCRARHPADRDAHGLFDDSSTPRVLHLSRQPRTSVQFLAKQAAIAIRNASLYEAEHAEATRIRALTNVNRRISSALELDTLLRTISDSAAELTGAKLVTFWLADEQRRTLSFTSSTVPEMMASYSPTIMTYDQGASMTSGIQSGAGAALQYSCNTATLVNGMVLSYMAQ